MPAGRNGFFKWRQLRLLGRRLCAGRFDLRRAGQPVPLAILRQGEYIALRVDLLPGHFARQVRCA